MEIKRLSSQAYRKIYNDLIKSGVDYVAQYNTIEDVYDLKIKLNGKCLISKTDDAVQILFTRKAIYIWLDKGDYNMITIY